MYLVSKNISMNASMLYKQNQYICIYISFFGKLMCHRMLFVSDIQKSEEKP